MTYSFVKKYLSLHHNILKPTAQYPKIKQHIVNFQTVCLMYKRSKICFYKFPHKYYVIQKYVYYVHTISENWAYMTYL